MSENEKTCFYDPPSGWRYGFPLPYLPLEGESLKDTLIRDGYPEKDAEFGAKHCRFIGHIENWSEFQKKLDGKE